MKDLGVGRRSLRNILIHLVETEIYWVSVLRGTEFEQLNHEEFTTPDSIRALWCGVETETSEFLENLNDEQLHHVKTVTWGENTINFTVRKALLHLVTHETHHRGLIIGLIRQLGFEPPDVNML